MRRAVPERMKASEIWSPDRKPAHCMRMSMACVVASPRPGRAGRRCPGSSGPASSWRRRSGRGRSASSPASVRARRAASGRGPRRTVPRRANRRCSIPVRWRIHSSVVSMSSESRSFVTMPSGTNIPDPRTTVVGGGTRRSYRTAPPAQTGRPRGTALSAQRREIDVGACARRLPQSRRRRSCRRHVDADPAAGLIRDPESGEHRVDARAGVIADLERELARPATRRPETPSP